MRRASHRPVEEIDLQVVVAPIAHDLARQVVKPLPDLGVRPVERVNAPAPIVPRVHHQRGAIGATQQPGRMRCRNAGPLRDGEGRDPQPGEETLRVNTVGQPTVAVRELFVRVPVARGPLVAVVNLDVAEEAPVELGGAKVEIGHDIGFGDRIAQLVP